MLHLKRSPGIRSWSLLIGRIMMYCIHWPGCCILQLRYNLIYRHHQCQPVPSSIT
uniref:Uncharacterized protein n=1 Tax=Oncorhynchus mykiss TaxID=8022 RepID=A0A8K9VFG5_ONCMY